MVTTVLEKLMNFPQINLNQMQKVRCFSAGWVARTISDKQQQSCPSRYWWEAGNVILLRYFFQLGRVMRQLQAFLRQ